MNCSQIFCTFAVETTERPSVRRSTQLWIALKFFVLLQSKQHSWHYGCHIDGCELLSNFLYFCSRNNRLLILVVIGLVVNCSQIFCTFAVETTHLRGKTTTTSCELLSNFLYFCSRNNTRRESLLFVSVVNCSQIFCTFAVETTTSLISSDVLKLWIALKFFVLLQSKQLNHTKRNWGCRCELLSNFLYFCSRNNRKSLRVEELPVVNCSQIFCTFAVETT